MKAVRLSVALTALNVLDAATTVLGTAYGAVELNPFFKPTVLNIAVKLWLCMLLCAVAAKAEETFKKYRQRFFLKALYTVLTFTVLLYTFTVLNNLLVLTQIF